MRHVSSLAPQSVEAPWEMARSSLSNLVIVGRRRQIPAKEGFRSRKSAARCFHGLLRLVVMYVGRRTERFVREQSKSHSPRRAV